MSAKNLSNDELIQQIAATLRHLIEPGQVTELRALNYTGPGLTLSGYFDDQHLNEMAASAVALEAECSGVYFMLNPLRPDLLSRRANEVDQARKGELAGDADVLRRVRLLVDIDPVRPGTVSATMEEKRRAAEGMVRVHNHLHERGWPSPLVVDSGNGYQLLFRVDLPTDDGGLVKRVLHALAQRFNTEQVHVDTSVFNPARICKLPGTLARKGEATRDRPHRRSKVVQHGGEVCVPRDLLEALAVEVASPKAVVPVPSVQRQQSPASSQVVQRARAYLAPMPPAISGQGGHDQTFAVACALVVGFGLTVEEARPLLGEYSQRCVPPWSEPELEHKLEDAAKKADESHRVGYLLAESKSDEDDEKLEVSPTDAMIALASEGELFHEAGSSRPFAFVPHKGVWLTMPVNGSAFERWLRHQLWDSFSITPKPHHVEDAVSHLSAMACFDGPSKPVGVRVLGHTDGQDERVYLDLCDEQGEVVEVRAGGWQVVASQTVPVRFRRSPSLLPLPRPVAGGSIAELRRLVNVASDADFILLVSWLTMALRPTGPYPVLLFVGEQGCGKTSAQEALRGLLDPHEPPHRGAPHSEEDLWLGAVNSWVLFLDNLSQIRPWLSDNLCRLATGSGFSTRKFYVNDEEVHFKACRPVMLNSIIEVAERPDLLDRCLIVNIPPLDTKTRMTRNAWRGALQDATPRLIGALLNGVATALANYKHVDADELPRMADFYTWSVAAAPAFGWTAEEFEVAYWQNIQQACAIALEDTPIVTPLRKLLAVSSPWPPEGQMRTVEDLLKELNALAGGTQTAERKTGWPKRPSDLSALLRRLTLSPEEVAALLAAARSGPDMRGLRGPDRALLYSMALYTGLRASELASLTTDSLLLDGETPAVVVAAAYSKHRREDRVPLHPDIVAQLREWVASKARDSRLWPGRWAKGKEAGVMLKADLERAGVPYKTEAGYADFHALRHSFISNLVRSGANPRVAMALARHSTIELTMNRYAHVLPSETVRALAALPALPKQEQAGSEKEPAA